jgi:hypothetical protein
MKAGDLLLLCSDGLCSMVVDEAIEQLIDPNDLQGSINQLHSMAMNNGGKDNITIILLKVTESPHVSSDFTHYTTKYQSQNTQNIPRIQDPVGLTIPPPQPIKKNRGFLIGIAASLIIGVGIYFYLNSNNSETAQVNIDKVKDNQQSKNNNDKSGDTGTTTSDVSGIEDLEGTDTQGAKRGSDQQSNNDDEKQKNDILKGDKKAKAERLKSTYIEDCKKYKELCNKKKDPKTSEEAKPEIAKEINKLNQKLSTTWIEWNNTGLRPDTIDECECD